MNKLKMYMGYDRQIGSEESAVLIFANSAKEARKIAYKELDQDCYFGTDWIDVATRWLKNHEYLRVACESDRPHVAMNPPTCERCEMWGSEKFDPVLEICGSCREEQDE